MPTPFPSPKRINVNGINLAVYEQGQGQPVVLVHGFPEIAYSWRHQMAALAAAGYHVIAPDMRGYGGSDRPDDVAAYDMHHLCGDLTGLLDHYGYDDAIFIGHDWGAIVTWGMAQLHADRMKGLVALSVPFMPRSEQDPLLFWEENWGPDFYIVHFNRQPGVAAAEFDRDPENFLRNMYRTNQWKDPGFEALSFGSEARMGMIEAVDNRDYRGELMMPEDDFQVFVDVFRRGGFTGPTNWYRNFTRNWEMMADAPCVIDLPALMIYGAYDAVPKLDSLPETVPNVTIETLDCGHWIQQERPQETNDAILRWLKETF